MRVLIACEYSGIVADAFRRRGHTVLSCDLLPSESPGAHYIGDIRSCLDLMPWDLLIGFPPCTYLSKAQIWPYRLEPERVRLRDEAVKFFKMLYNSCNNVALENPPGYLSAAFRPPDQIIQPHWFGNSHRKEICLWLKNVPPLICTIYSSGRRPVSNHTNSRMSQITRSKIRSRFFPEVAEAMAHQWESLDY